MISNASCGQYPVGSGRIDGTTKFGGFSTCEVHPLVEAPLHIKSVEMTINSMMEYIGEVLGSNLPPTSLAEDIGSATSYEGRICCRSSNRVALKASPLLSQLWSLPLGNTGSRPFTITGQDSNLCRFSAPYPLLEQGG